MVAWLYWNPQREALVIPIFDWPIMWYGVLFVLGLIIGYFIVRHMISQVLSASPHAVPLKGIAAALADRLTWFVVAGTIIGARLGHVFFYEWDYFSRHPAEIPMTWKGGLASHGGAIGIILALAFYRLSVRKQFPELSFLRIMDIVVLPAALVGFFIRIGNFVNQEIVGTPSQLPWAVIFPYPAEGVAAVPRHPVQLYEAFAYLAIFIVLYKLWARYTDKLPDGYLTGIFFVLVFSSRFVLEFFKEAQGGLAEGWSIQTGQALSIPFILIGVLLIFVKHKPFKLSN